jgi:hypothetical protein
MRNLRLLWLLLIPCNNVFAQGIPSAGYEPKGEFTRPSKYAIEKNLSSSRIDRHTRLFLNSSPRIFPRSPEILGECSGHWNSNILEVNINGLDHDYFTVTLLITDKEYQISFSWISDMNPDHPITVVPTSSLLKLSTYDFQKGKAILGYLELRATCKGCGNPEASFEIHGDFEFSSP